MQKELDQFIKDSKGYTLSEIELFEDKMVALFTEMGELANEHRGFKFWSNNNQYDDGGELINSLTEELIDTFHFILSVGNDLGYKLDAVVFEKPCKEIRFQELMLDWQCVYADFYRDSSKKNYIKMFKCFGRVVDYLGLNSDDVFVIYKYKYNKNIERQRNGY